MINLYQHMSPNFRLIEMVNVIYSKNPREGIDMEATLEGVTNNIIDNLRKSAYACEQIRVMCGNKRMFLNSVFRTPKHNDEVGGEPGSWHLKGLAWDFTIEGQSPAVTQSLLHSWRGGLGKYKTWTHADLGPMRRWP